MQLVGLPRQLSSTDFAPFVVQLDFVGSSCGKHMGRGDGIRGYEGGRQFEGKHRELDMPDSFEGRLES